MIQGIYFNAMPAHLRPAKAVDGVAGNRGLTQSMRDTSGRYAVASEAEQFFKRKVLPVIEAHRAAGDIVRFFNGVWHVNGQALRVQ